MQAPFGGLVTDNGRVSPRTCDLCLSGSARSGDDGAKPGRVPKCRSHVAAVAAPLWKEMLFILLIALIREETLIKVHTTMSLYGEPSRRKHKTSNKDQRQAPPHPPQPHPPTSLHTPDNCVHVYHSITSLCHSRGNVNQQYGNCAIMEALIIIKVSAIIPGGGVEGRRWGEVSVASCCSRADQDVSSAGGNRGFNCSQVCVSFAGTTCVYFSTLVDLRGE